MVQYSSYYLYQKYEKRGSQDWIPCIPNTFSVSGDSTNPMPLSIKNECDYQCGCNTKFRATYLGGATYELFCDGNPTLTKGETKPTGYTASAMTSGEIGGCVISLEYDVFRHCSSLTSVTISDSVISIGNYAFSDCDSLASITIPRSVTSIGGGGTTCHAFYESSGLTSVTFENGSQLTEIGYACFYGCTSLTTVNIPNTVTLIGDFAFLGCRSLSSIDIPSGVTSIGDAAFRNCEDMTSVSIPNNVTTIGSRAFSFCTSLTSCTIGTSVTSIGVYAFYGCGSLTSITCLATTPPTLGDYHVFENTNDCPIYVPSASVNAYKSATNWSTYSSRIQAIP